MSEYKFLNRKLFTGVSMIKINPLTGGTAVAGYRLCCKIIHKPKCTQEEPDHISAVLCPVI
jgi:hypothetical protein